jgi:hypothetical protein
MPAFLIGGWGSKARRPQDKCRVIRLPLSADNKHKGTASDEMRDTSVLGVRPSRKDRFGAFSARVEIISSF